jgi:hypothetical protein
MGADSSAENTPNAPAPIYLPILSTRAQNFLISMKKRLHWASEVHEDAWRGGLR